MELISEVVVLDKGFNGEFFEQVCVCKSTDFKNSHSMPTDDRLPPGRGDLLLLLCTLVYQNDKIKVFEFKEVY